MANCNTCKWRPGNSGCSYQKDCYNCEMCNVNGACKCFCVEDRNNCPYYVEED